MLRHLMQHKGVILLMSVAVTLSGCVASEPTQGTDPSFTTVIGTWTYRASGSQPLSKGTLQLRATRGRLMGRLRDAQLGAVPVDARIHGERLTLRLDVFRFGRVSVSGLVDDNRFQALVDRPFSDATVSPEQTRRTQRTVRGSFLAVRRGQSALRALPLNCPRLGPDGLTPCR